MTETDDLGSEAAFDHSALDTPGGGPPGGAVSGISAAGMSDTSNTPLNSGSSLENLHNFTHLIASSSHWVRVTSWSAACSTVFH